MAKNTKTQKIVEAVDTTTTEGFLIVPENLKSETMKKRLGDKAGELKITTGRYGKWEASSDLIRLMQEIQLEIEAKRADRKPRSATEFEQIFKTEFYTRKGVEFQLESRTEFEGYRMVGLPQVFIAVDSKDFESLQLEKGEGLTSRLAETLRDEFFHVVGTMNARLEILETAEKIVNLPEPLKGKRGRPANVSVLRQQGIADYEGGRVNFAALGFDLPAAPSVTEGPEWDKFETEHPLIASAISKGAVNSSTLSVILQAYR